MVPVLHISLENDILLPHRFARSCISSDVLARFPMERLGLLIALSLVWQAVAQVELIKSSVQSISNLPKSQLTEAVCTVDRWVSTCISHELSVYWLTRVRQRIEKVKALVQVCLI